MIALHREADRDWMADAACRNHDGDMWFPTPGQNLRSTATALALAICARCPVRQRCADYADAHREQYGVWGGQTVEQRNQRARGKAGER